jgi:hypothetical protein
VQATDICQTGEAQLVGSASSYGLTPGSTHWFRVVLLKSELGGEPWIGVSPPTEPVAITLPEVGVPTLRGTCTLDFGEERGDGRVPLSWQVESPAGGIDSFWVEYSADGFTGWSQLALVSYDPSLISYVLTDAPPAGAQRYYRVRSIFTDGSPSAFSNVVKERATLEDRWCDLDRQVQDRAVNVATP